MIVTDHNSAMSELLADEKWVRVIPSGSAEALARAIEDLAEKPLPRPDRDAPRRFGLHSPSDQIAAFLRIADSLPY
jgi:glycosyltransferase involved in cell wall biosynthesis